ncbi:MULTISPECIES: hypothetical protein [Streptomyces]|uniref:hypothetical protein n=1 Tax=Streptomyces TaxID=1883 RepID=UPI00211D1B25|nr:hypothetical protein [Streptomyces sp. wa1063]
MGRHRDLPLPLLSPGRAQLDTVGCLVDRGELRPVIGTVLPLDEVPRAHVRGRRLRRHGPRMPPRQDRHLRAPSGLATAPGHAFPLSDPASSARDGCRLLVRLAAVPSRFSRRGMASGRGMLPDKDQGSMTGSGRKETAVHAGTSFSRR